MNVHIRARVPKVRIPQESRTSILTALRRSGAYQESLQAVRGTFETWSPANKPSVTTRDMRAGIPVASQGAVWISIDIDSFIWDRLDEGFWRYVRMSPTFIPKTHPGSMLSGPGGGRRDPIGYSYPPVWTEAREWSKQLQEFAADALAADAEHILRTLLHETGFDLWGR